MGDYGLMKVCACSPQVRVADVDYNWNEIKECAWKAYRAGAQVVVFPELCLTGYTCADLFQQSQLLNAVLAGLEAFKTALPKDMAVIIGAPMLVSGKLYNMAVAINQGNVISVPKTYLPNYGEFYEDRWFSAPGDPFYIGDTKDQTDSKPGMLLLHLLTGGDDETYVNVGVEICEDLWAPNPPSTSLALAGADVILNLSASNELVGKSEYRRDLVKQTSARSICGYMYVSAGPTESTTDLVFSGHRIAAENGVILAESPLFERESSFTYATFDVEKIRHDRMKNTSFHPEEGANLPKVTGAWMVVRGYEYDSEKYEVCQTPLVSNPKEAFQIQVNALATRIQAVGAKKLAIGVSGGLDSTLALLVAVGAVDLLDLPRTAILGVTMPGFGTTSSTKNLAKSLMLALRIELMEVDITNAVTQHLKDIGLPMTDRSVTYENAQARERTQILMDLANKESGMVIGTGDLSELALGWCTYNGDHMSMYSVNCSVPKTLVRHIVAWAADNLPGLGSSRFAEARGILKDILDLPISPELLPPDEEGNITQLTEDVIGPYVLHDFFLYYVVRWGFTRGKIQYLAERAFQNVSCETIDKWLDVFYKRFFSSQFKRSCVPDGPKIGSVSLSPRGDWRMPSDARSDLWRKS